MITVFNLNILSGLTVNLVSKQMKEMAHLWITQSAYFDLAEFTTAILLPCSLHMCALFLA